MSPLVPLISQAEIADTVARLAQTLDQDYANKSPVVIGVLKGAFIFLSDLIRQMQTPIQRVELIRLSSYGAATTSSGNVKILMDLPPDLIAGQDVILVEDIVDTGRSTSVALANLAACSPASLKLCSLLDKPSRRQVPVTIDYLGLTIPDRFIVGYGLDMDEQYRQLPGIFVVEA
ncbi:MAG: hypoxanthine phosphoribosyltransferase [Cyanobacteria bacterium Co-bin13]|nr:hypoxanthine phosphoribosyltransferase [Cyanobacteria bacterium Co-bin13]